MYFIFSTKIISHATWVIYIIFPRPSRKLPDFPGGWEFYEVQCSSRYSRLWHTQSISRQSTRTDTHVGFKLTCYWSFQRRSFQPITWLVHSLCDQQSTQSYCNRIQRGESASFM